MLSNQYGGAIPVRLLDGELIPDRAVYRATLEVENLPVDLTAHLRRGKVVIRASSASIARKWMQASMSVLWREFGF